MQFFNSRVLKQQSLWVCSSLMYMICITRTQWVCWFVVSTMGWTCNRGKWDRPPGETLADWLDHYWLALRAARVLQLCWGCPAQSWTFTKKPSIYVHRSALCFKVSHLCHVAQHWYNGTRENGLFDESLQQQIYLLSGTGDEFKLSCPCRVTTASTLPSPSFVL